CSDSGEENSLLTGRNLQRILQVAGLHESPTPPALIIVDRLEDFLSGSAGSGHVGLHSAERLSAAHLSALLCDTSAFLTHVLQQQGSSSSPCCLIASFLSKEDSQKNLINIFTNFTLFIREVPASALAEAQGAAQDVNTRAVINTPMIRI
uniref:SWIM-type zinc finger 7 associated protein 1 n=1 Tax=Nothobranchius furzeri TaxID=105023 RepID=A0A8C6KPW0_NOTFU